MAHQNRGLLAQIGATCEPCCRCQHATGQRTLPPKHQSRPWFPDDAKRQGYLDCAYQLGRESDLPVSRGHVLVREL